MSLIDTLLLTAEADDKLHPDPNAPSRWINRRRLAYMAMWSMIFIMMALMSPVVSDSRVEALRSVTEWFFLSMGSIVGAYMGFSTWLSGKTPGATQVAQAPVQAPVVEGVVPPKTQ